MGVVLLGIGLVTGAAPATAADSSGWPGVEGLVFPGGANGSGSIDYQALLRVVITYTDPRCVNQTTDFHPNGVVNTHIGGSTYTSPPLSQWTATTTQSAFTTCHDSTGNLLTGVAGTITRTTVAWTQYFSCEPSGLGITGTLTDPDAGLTDATGLVTVEGRNAAWFVPYFSGPLPTSCPTPAPVPVITPSATEGSPGSTLTVTGTGYVPGSPATLTFDTDMTSTPVGSATVGAGGTFTARITVPPNAPTVQDWLVVSSTGSFTRRVPFWVHPSLSVSPASGGVASSFTLTGSHYAGGEQLTVRLGTITIGKLTAGADGTFTFSGVVPPSAAQDGPSGYASSLSVEGPQDATSVPFAILPLTQSMDAKAAAWGLGTATSTANYILNGGYYRNYQYGAILFPPSGYLFVSHGAIRGEWGALGFENGAMGYPTSDEVGGLVNGGVYQNYDGGAILWSPATGPHESLGPIRSEWAATGFEGGRLGYPTTEVVSGLVNGGSYQNYQRGAIVSSPASGTHESLGAIRSEWQATGFEHGVLRYPTTDEVGGLRNGGVYQNYQGGAVIWSPGTGAHESYGPLRAAWQSTGFEGGRLGYPTSEVYAVPNGTAQNFQGGKITDINGTITIS